MNASGSLASHTRIRRAWCVIVAVAAALAVLPAIASANHYAYAYMTGQNQHGGDITIRSNVLNVPNLSTDFVNNNFWVDDSTETYWVEAGMIHGSADNFYAGSPSFYWADNRPNGGGFHGHLGGGASLNTYYDDNISTSGNGDWYVTVGTFSGTSTRNYGSDGVVITGTEESTTSATVCSSQSSLAWYDGAGGYHAGWSDASFGQALRHDDQPPFSYWVSRPNWLRDYENASC